MSVYLPNLDEVWYYMQGLHCLSGWVFLRGHNYTCVDLVVILIPMYTRVAVFRIYNLYNYVCMCGGQVWIESDYDNCYFINCEQTYTHPDTLRGATLLNLVQSCIQ